MKQNLPSAEEYAAELAQFAAFELVDLDQLQRALTEPYKNQVLLDANGECMRLAVFEGEYRCHYHPSSDELFLVLASELHIEFEGRAETMLAPMQLPGCAGRNDPPYARRRQNRQHHVRAARRGNSVCGSAA